MMRTAFSKHVRSISTIALAMSWGVGCAHTARKRLQALANIPDYRKIGRELAMGLSQGAIDGLAARGQVLTATRAQGLTNQLGSAIADQIESRIRPAVANVAAAAIASALRELASDRTRRELAALSAEMARSVAEGTGAALRDQIGPALRAAIEKDVGPALASTSYEAGKNATLGATDAGFGALLSKAIAMIAGLLVLFGIVLIALALLFAKLIADRRSARAESERREAALAAVAGALHDAENRPWSRELFDLLQKHVAYDSANPLGDVRLHAR
jgi:hypothetical protein